MNVNYPGEALGDLFNDLVAGDRNISAIGQALEAVQQSVRIVVFFREAAAFGTGVTPVYRGVEVAFDLGDPIAIQRDDDGAAGTAVAADEGFPGDGLSPMRLAVRSVARR